jgi:Predicted integral membrane protein
MKIRCDVIQDLLPLYVEDMASEGSRELVEEHIKDCDDCSHILNKIKQPDIEVTTSDLDQVKLFAHKFKKHTFNIAVLSAFITVAVISLVSGLFFLKPGEEMGYVVFYFYLVMPVTAFICSLILGLRATKLKYLSPLIFGAFGLIIPAIVFRNFDLFALGFGFYPSLFGLMIGHIIYLLRRRKKHR